MYRGSSPIFDAPEFPTLRRVKPLPKRRRTSDTPQSISNINSTLPPPLPSTDATAEELLAHADSLSAQMALQSYYMPMLGGVQDLFRNDMDNRGVTSAIDFNTGYGVGDGRGGQGDEDHGEGDYVDHLQQPGNTKKRKVPANASSPPHGHHDTAPSHSPGEDVPTEGSVPTGRVDHDPLEILQSISPLRTLGQRKGKLTPATLAGLQHKEMLKNRKRQLAAVLGALSHGDTLALDQALSANYPFINGGFDDLKGSGPPKVRLSRRRGPRLARTMRTLDMPSTSHRPRESSFPVCKFTFACPSTSEW